MTTLLCIVAHPDDETMLCGGTLAALAARGVTIQVLCATRGEGGELGQPAVCTRDELPRVREAEMRCACRALGVRHVTFLDYADPLIGPDGELSAFTEDQESLSNQLLVALQAAQPEVLFTHGKDGEYGHPAHQLLHRATQEAFQPYREASGNAALYTIAAAVPGVEDHLYNDSEPAHLLFELEGTPWLDTKERAALCHRTQHALFKRRKKAETVREVLRRVESLHRHWPPQGAHPPTLLKDGRLV